MRIKKIGNPLRDLLNYYPITKSRALAISRVHRTTFERWWKGESKPPAAALELIKREALAELPGRKFEGWRVAGDYLVDQNGVEYHHDDIKRLDQYKRLAYQYLDVMKNCTIQNKLFTD